MTIKTTRAYIGQIMEMSSTLILHTTVALPFGSWRRPSLRLPVLTRPAASALPPRILLASILRRGNRIPPRLLPRHGTGTGTLPIPPFPRHTTTTQRRLRLPEPSLPGRTTSVQQARLGSPARVGLGGQHLHLQLAADLCMLLGDGGRGLAGVPQPLVPLGRNLDLAVVRVARVLHDAAPAGGRVRRVTADVAELPVGVALEVEACLMWCDVSQSVSQVG